MRLTPIALLWFALLAAAAGAQDDGPTDEQRAEREFDALRESLLPKLREYRTLTEEDREEVSFQSELAAIGAFVRRYRESAPDYADAARIFLGKEVLSSTLGKHRQGREVLGEVVVEARDPLVAGMAAVHAAEIALTTRRPPAEIRVLVDLYTQREEHDPQFVQILEHLEVRARLQPGQPLPPFSLPSLSDPESMLRAESPGRVLLVVFYNPSHPSANPMLEAVKRVRESPRTAEVSVFLVAVADDRDVVRKQLDTLKVPGEAACDGLGWESPVLKQFGISTLPASFLTDRSGILRHRDVPVGEVLAFVNTVLEESDAAEGEDDGG